MKGFTLIELLVVIAIIGILSSVVLASLNTARNKGADTAVKSNLAGARAQAELFYDANGNSYDNGTLNVCGTTAAAGVKTINSAVLAAVQATGGTSVGTGPSTASAGTCNDSATAWGAEAYLKNGTTGGYYCVDSTGAAATSSSSMLAGSTDYTC